MMCGDMGVNRSSKMPCSMVSAFSQNKLLGLTGQMVKKQEKSHLVLNMQFRLPGSSAQFRQPRYQQNASLMSHFQLSSQKEQLSRELNSSFVTLVVMGGFNFNLHQVGVGSPYSAKFHFSKTNAIYFDMKRNIFVRNKLWQGIYFEITSLSWISWHSSIASAASRSFAS